jgi:glycosyltransferase involved in cell wall biosynthesis
MKTIIHISADFPDSIVPAKTKAVANLLAATPGFRHIVYSLNRTHKPGVISSRFDNDHTAIAYGAPPYGIGLERFLRPVAASIQRDLEERGIHPDLIHAHKFSVEGLVAMEVARRRQCPFVCSLWGDTDIRIFEFKRGLRSRYRAVATAAQALLPAAPWTGDYFRNALQISDDKINLLPVMTAADAILSPTVTGAPKLVSLFHLDSWKRKGFDQLVKAGVLAARDIPDLTIDVFGTGKAKSIRAVEAVVRRNNASSIVRVMGALPHDKVQHVLNGYTGFVMAPHRETYGMVHVEALLAGLPIVWSQNRGVDGLFDGHDVGYRADPTSVEDVARGMRCLIEREQSLKINIGHLHQNRTFDHLRRHRIAEVYSDILTRETREPAHPAPEGHRMAS